ncbi:class I SAM-dependent methyltransferase, partial [bacterium]
PRPRELLALALPYLRPRGLILDLAMGLGVNARWLVEHEFRVVGVDIASKAVLQAKRRCPPLMGVIADLNEFPIPTLAFDAVLNFYFLDRGLLQDLARIVRPGGFAIVETLMVDMLEIRPDMPREYLLQKEELPGFFSAWNILFYQEGWRASDHGGQKSIARLIAQAKA